MKQMIEINVPDGYEFAEVQQIGDHHSLIHFKKKQPELIEVRTYLAVDSENGEYYPIAVTGEECNSLHNNDPEFVKWIDDEPRKVEI